MRPKYGRITYLFLKLNSCTVGRYDVPERRGEFEFFNFVV